jgi:hypothetical protein
MQSSLHAKQVEFSSMRVLCYFGVIENHR